MNYDHVLSLPVELSPLKATMASSFRFDIPSREVGRHRLSPLLIPIIAPLLVALLQPAPSISSNWKVQAAVQGHNLQYHCCWIRTYQSVAASVAVIYEYVFSYQNNSSFPSKPQWLHFGLILLLVIGGRARTPRHIPIAASSKHCLGSIVTRILAVLSVTITSGSAIVYQQ